MSQSSRSVPLLQQRRDARIRKDAHHVHPLQRVYIGPSPVNARSAAAVAALIAHDVEISHPMTISVVDAQGRIQMATGGEEIPGMRNSTDSAPAALNADRSSLNGPASPIKRPPDLAPLHIPRSNHLLRKISRTNSTGDGDRPSPSAAFTSSPIPLTPNRSRSARRLMSQSLAEDRQASGTGSTAPNVKFDLHDPRLRRQYSESSAYDLRSSSHRFDDAGPSIAGERVLPLLDVSVDEEGPDAMLTPESSPQKGASQATPRRTLDVVDERNVRHTPSFQSFGGRSNASTVKRMSGVRKQPSASTMSLRKQRSVDGSVIDRGIGHEGDQTYDTAMLASDALNTSRTEWTGNALSDTDTMDKRKQQASRLEIIRERARRRYMSNRFSRNVSLAGDTSRQKPDESDGGPIQPQKQQHGREPSRQSRFSYVSAAGTHTSVGTRFTEGSFGANGGFRAKLVRSLGLQPRERAPTSQSVRAEARRRGRHSTSSRGGVVPGAVGTSAGGTKWVGQSFDIGSRFWQALENREEQLCGAHDTFLEVVREEDVKERVKPKTLASETASAILHSPEDVLSRYAREASQSQEDGDEAGSRNRNSMRAISPAVKRNACGPPQSHTNGHADPRKQDGNDKASTSKHELTRIQSAASLLTVPQDREVTSGWDIESRKGWSDVVSFITAQSQLPASFQRSARSATDNINEMGNRARRALDSQIAEIRSRSTHEQRPLLGKDLENDAFTTKMTLGEALQKPAAPFDQKVDGRLAEATFELTRRPSLPGIAPGGQTNDAASDHEVAARPTMNGLDEDEKDVQQQAVPRSALSQVGRSILPKKSVQFRPELPLRSLTLEEVPAARLAQNDSPGEESKLQLLAGRLRPAVLSGDAAPAPPEEVLSRQPSPSVASPAERKAVQYIERETPSLKEALKRDRMLVKVAWTPSEDVPKEFTERESRKYELHADSFREYMVVFRAGRLELWDDPSLAARAIGHGDRLHLSYVAPLRRGRAFVSLYSPIDTIICLSFIADHHRSLFNLRRSGTHIWLFDARSASTSGDWMWEMWRELGGQIPDALDVHIPVMGTRVRVPIPDQVVRAEQQHDPQRTTSRKTLIGKVDNDSDASDDTLFGEGYKIITLKNVVAIVSDLLRSFTQWWELSAALQRAGMQFGLAWRTNLRLNWVQHSFTTDGQRRDWAVLVGALLCDSKSQGVLEFRAKAHYPYSVKNGKGREMLEPAAIEGFIWRVKAVSGNLTRLYISTQDGLLFINRPSRAYPPSRYVATDVQQTHQLRRADGSITNLSVEKKGRTRRNSKSSGNKMNSSSDESWSAMGKRVAELTTAIPSALEELDAQIEAYRGYEKRRLFEQINSADGYVDVRDIFQVRSLDEERGLVRRPGADDDDDVDEHWKCSARGEKGEHLDTPPEEEEDVGGEEGYAMAKDRAALKRARQFEVMLINGRAIRLEAYSRSVAREWILRLSDIARYWKRREKADALMMMNASGFDERLYKRMTHAHHQPRPFDKAANSDRLSPLLGRIWNWCTLEACRTILRSGRLFTKKKPYTAFTSRYCILVSGRLLTYKLMTSNRTARARQNAGIFHKRQETVIHLRDSYVYSGKLSDHMLVNGRSDGAGAIGNFGGGSGGASTSTSRHTLPRVYGDGMLSVDDDEECTFVIRYRPQRVNRSADPQVNVADTDMLSTAAGVTTTAAADRAHASGGKVSVNTLRDSVINVIAMRARSKLERDLWVWAINVERERMVREDSARESRLRNNGKTPFKAHH